MNDRDLINRERELNQKIKDLILGKVKDIKSLNSDLIDFFKSKEQRQINLLNPTNIRLFVSALEIFKNFENTKIEKANLDYIYSYKKKPLKYIWKSARFDIRKTPTRLKNSIEKILEKGKFSKENKEKMLRFVDWGVEKVKEKYGCSLLSEDFGIINKNKDTFLYIDISLFYDEYHKEENLETDVLIITTKENKKPLNNLPNNKGSIYANLIIKKHIEL